VAPARRRRLKFFACPSVAASIQKISQARDHEEPIGDWLSRAAATLAKGDARGLEGIARARLGAS
jgi:hypothetical protein